MRVSQMATRGVAWRRLPHLPHHLLEIVLDHVRRDQWHRTIVARDVSNAVFCTDSGFEYHWEYELFEDHDCFCWCPCRSRDCHDSWFLACPVRYRWGRPIADWYCELWWLDNVAWNDGGCWCHNHDLVVCGRNKQMRHPRPRKTLV